jgi:hypothetical protein
MQHQTRRDPRPGLLSAEELRKTTQPLRKEPNHPPPDQATLKRAVEDLDRQVPQSPKD